MKKCENLLQCKYSHIFLTKNNIVFVILTFSLKFNETYTDNIVTFEQPAPEYCNNTCGRDMLPFIKTILVGYVVEILTLNLIKTGSVLLTILYRERKNNTSARLKI